MKLEETNPDEPHGKHFGTRIYAINTRAYCLFRLNAVVPGETYEFFDVKGLVRVHNYPRWVDEDTAKALERRQAR